MTTILLLLLLAQPFEAAGAAQQAPKAEEYTMTTYQAVLVTKGTKWTPETAEVMPLVRAHRAYVSDLLRSGRAHIGGPFAGDSALRGVYFVPDTPEAAKALAEADPGVKEGRYGVEILQWMGPEGWFQKADDTTRTETLYFGILVTGDNSAPVDPVEMNGLMTAHLGHMDAQAKIGKLVMGGPLVKAAPRRGLIVYRVPTMAEALERASADPMVKAGRMKPELYEWRVPAGILK